MLRTPPSSRFMLGLAGVPSLIMFVGMLFMPETPRWLVFRGREERARAVLSKVRSSPSAVDEELRDIVSDYEEHKKSGMGEYHCAFHFKYF